MQTRVIVVANMKGGVGKTTTAGVLAHGLARKQMAGGESGRVVAVDLDPQGNLADYFGVRERVYDAETNKAGACVSFLLTGERPLKQTVIPLDRAADGLPRPNLYLVPASRRLERVAEELLVLDFQRQRRPGDDERPPLDDVLSHYLAPLLGRVAYIVIDTPPKLDTLKSAVYRVADEVVVPTKPDHLSVVGCVQHTNDLVAYNSAGAKARLAWVVPTMAIGRQVMDRAMMDNLHAAYGPRVADAIPQSVVVKESSGVGGRTLLEYAEPTHPARVAYEALVDRVAGGVR